MPRNFRYIQRGKGPGWVGVRSDGVHPNDTEERLARVGFPRLIIDDGLQKPSLRIVPAVPQFTNTRESARNARLLGLTATIRKCADGL